MRRATHFLVETIETAAQAVLWNKGKLKRQPGTFQSAFCVLLITLRNQGSP
jgi:hypothetical protein